MSSNYAAPGAHVGMQVDGDVVIEGGLNISMTGVTFGRATSGKNRDRQESGTYTDDDGSTVNVASGNDTVAVQAGRVHGRRK